jgi:chromosome segregation ATPase
MLYRARSCVRAYVAYNERMENETEIEKLARMIKSEFDGVRGEMREGFAAVDKRFAAVDKRFAAVDKRFEDVEDRLGTFDERFTGVEKQIAALDQKIDHVDAKLDAHRQETRDSFATLHRAVGGLSTTLVDHEERIKALEE